MSRGPINEQDYRPQFSGHETFPLRYGWLKKAFDAVRSATKEESKTLFSRPEAIADFGVGKNMVSSIRHWAINFGVIADQDGLLETTALGERIFAPRGFDPFLENTSTLWLLHWKLASNPNKSTWYWSFNLLANRVFERAMLVQHLSKLAKEQGWQRASLATIKRDVDCFVRTYVPKPVSKKFGYEDSVECPLTELGLIKRLDSGDRFQFVYGAKSNLGMGVFLFALDEYWSEAKPNTLSIETLAHGEGAPGRVFQLDESDLVYRFSEIEKCSNGFYRWSETAGLKQLIRNKPRRTSQERFDSLALDYQTDQREEVA